MIKILYISQFPHIGGGETVLLELISNLDRKVFTPIVCLPKPGQLSKKLKKMGVKTYYLNLNPYLIRTFFVPGLSGIGLIRLIGLIRRLKPDLIHINHLTLAIYAGIAGKPFRIPVVATAHGVWDSIYFYQDLIIQIFTDKILANTGNLKKALLKRRVISSKKVAVAYFGVDTDKFRPSSKTDAKIHFGINPKSLVVTIVGRLDPIKDHQTFFRACEIVQSKIKNVTFLVVGSSAGNFSNSSFQLPASSFQHSNILFTGFIYNMPKVYQATDVLVSSSVSESFGLSLVEAQSCAVPVVATNTGNQHLIIKNGSTGFLVPPKNPEALAQKILVLLKNPSLRKKFGEAGRKHIVNNFPLENYINQVQQTYLSFLRR